jgi:DNA-binding NtrC family response regulator
MNRTGSILVIEDEEIMREILEALLTREGYTVRLAVDAEAGLELARTMSFDLAIVDVMMPGMDGMRALDELKKIDDDLPVVMITAYASVESAITAMKRGAFHYITKPFKNDEVLVVLGNALAQRRLVVENRALRQNLQAHSNHFGEIIGRSPRMKQVFDLIIQAAPSRTTILINGESGTGKELVARSLHQNSTRADRAFITVNSGNLPPDLLESNLFGHVKGAFTGAIAARVGRFAAAHGGTIFLDEIGDMSPNLQVKLLRVLQDRSFEPVGSSKTERVDVRVIAATNQRLDEAIRRGTFRADLYYRLNVIPIDVPPLRSRKEDLPLLIDHFLARQDPDKPKRVTGITDAALECLIAHEWPGNVRELENLVERLIVMRGEGTIDVDDLPPPYRQADRPRHLSGLPSLGPAGLDLNALLETIETQLILQALERTGWNKNRAAQLLGLHRTTLIEKIKKRGLEPNERAEADELTLTRVSAS